MEVHHHNHESHGKKTWRSYFWEFMMLFLAVFCGFLAEYQLEHKIERDRTNELARSFYEELKSDSATAVLKVQNRIRQEQSLKYLMSYFRDSSLTDVSKSFAIHFEYGINFRTPSVFEPRTVVLEQLKNSGSLRYFKSEELQKLVGDLSVAVKNIADRQSLETTVRLEYLNPILIKYHDFEFWSAITDDANRPFDKALEWYMAQDTLIPFRLRDAEKIDRQGIINTLGFYRFNVLNSTRQVHIRKYQELNARLLGLLREEYGLE